MTKIELIKQAIRSAEQNFSALSEPSSSQVLDLPGFTSHKVKHLMNNLGAISTNYLEIGIHKGSTFIATWYKNKLERATGIDNYSQFDEDKLSKKLFWTAMDIARYADSKTALTIIDKDCFVINEENIDLGSPIDMYMYDGSHDYYSQKKAIAYYDKALADEFILVIDDYNWVDVRRGKEDGIKEAGYKILFEQHLTTHIESDENGWWNGIYVALLKK
ncbi:MAG: class I SAM-dependent methyltransferase [Bacteroidia bacterium]